MTHMSQRAHKSLQNDSQMTQTVMTVLCKPFKRCISRKWWIQNGSHECLSKVSFEVFNLFVSDVSDVSDVSGWNVLNSYDAPDPRCSHTESSRRACRFDQQHQGQCWSNALPLLSFAWDENIFFQTLGTTVGMGRTPFDSAKHRGPRNPHSP